jgi:hypothetical protein
LVLMLVLLVLDYILSLDSGETLLKHCEDRHL